MGETRTRRLCTARTARLNMASESKSGDTTEIESTAAAAAAPAAAAAASEQPRFEVKKWNAVALWAWGTSFAGCRTSPPNDSAISVQRKCNFISLVTNPAHLLVHRIVHLRHRGRQLRHLPQPHYGPLHRMPGQPGIYDIRGVHGSMGCLQSCIPFPLHLAVAQNAPGVSTRQPRLGIPEIRALKNLLAY